jgi:hypothetical protein
MRLVAIHATYEGCPPGVAGFGSARTETHISLGKEYEAHAIAVFQGTVVVQVINDLNIIVWKPAWFFKSHDSFVPVDWICNLFDAEPVMVIGPEFVASSLLAYNSMVELDDDQVQRFRQRLARIKEQES